MLLLFPHRTTKNGIKEHTVQSSAVSKAASPPMWTLYLGLHTAARELWKRLQMHCKKRTPKNTKKVILTIKGESARIAGGTLFICGNLKKPLAFKAGLAFKLLFDDIHSTGCCSNRLHCSVHFYICPWPSQNHYSILRLRCCVSG